MFQSRAEYYTILHLENQEVVSQLTGIPVLSDIQLSYPISDNEQLVMNAFYEVMSNLKQIDGVTTVRIANSLHYAYDKTAEDMDPGILERHDIFYHEKSVGTGVACTSGYIVPPLETLQ